MRTISVALFLVALVATQASLIEQIFNHSNLRGKANLNTTNGVNLDYNGSLSYNLSGYNLKILDLGVHFDARPETWKSTKDTQDATIKYNGGISVVNSGGLTTNVTVTGLTGVSNTISSKYDNKSGVTNVTFSQSISDNNSLVIRTGSDIALAKSSTGLSAAGLVQQKGNKIKVAEDVSLDFAVRGTITQNGTSRGSFTAGKSTSAHISEFVHVSPNATGHKPAADFVGYTNFTDAEYFTGLDTSVNVTKQGGAKFGGHTWVKNANGSIGVAVAEGVKYGFKQVVAVNNTVVAKSHAKGVAGIYYAVQTNTTANGSSVASFQAGKLRQFARTWLPGKNKTQNRTKSGKYVEMIDSEEGFFGSEEGFFGSEESTELFDINESGEFFRSGPGNGKEKDHHGHQKHHQEHHHHKHSIKSFVEAKWKSGSLTTTSLVSNSSFLVNSTNGVAYAAKGWDSFSKKPWNVNGSETVTASFKKSVSSIDLEDIVVKVGSNPAFSKKIGSLPDPKLPPLEKEDQGKGPKKDQGKGPKKDQREGPKKHH